MSNTIWEMGKGRLKITLRSAVFIQFPDDTEVIISRCDLMAFAEFAWFPVRGNGRTSYLVRNGENGIVPFHRAILVPPRGMEIDHLNGNGLDNRRENLRIVTHKENQNNLPDRGHSSKYRYVHWDKSRGSWVAMVRDSGKSKNIGRFSSEVEAACAANNYILARGFDKKLNVVTS